MNTGWQRDPEVQADLLLALEHGLSLFDARGLGLPGVLRMRHRESTVGIGTTFHVFLPISSISLEMQTSEVTQQVGGGWETVLLVDDDPAVARMTSMVLKKNGYNVLIAHNGEEAKRILEDERGIHLLLTDVVMPQVGGMELAAAFRRSAPGTPILFMSGYSGESLMGAGGCRSADKILLKPFLPSELLAHVREALG